MHRPRLLANRRRIAVEDRPCTGQVIGPQRQRVARIEAPAQQHQELHVALVGKRIRLGGRKIQHGPDPAAAARRVVAEALHGRDRRKAQVVILAQHAVPGGRRTAEIVGGRGQARRTVDPDPVEPREIRAGELQLAFLPATDPDGVAIACRRALAREGHELALGVIYPDFVDAQGFGVFAEFEGEFLLFRLEHALPDTFGNRLPGQQMQGSDHIAAAGQYLRTALQPLALGTDAGADVLQQRLRCRGMGGRPLTFRHPVHDERHCPEGQQRDAERQAEQFVFDGKSHFIGLV